MFGAHRAERVGPAAPFARYGMCRLDELRTELDRALGHQASLAKGLESVQAELAQERLAHKTAEVEVRGLKKEDLKEVTAAAHPHNRLCLVCV